MIGPTTPGMTDAINGRTISRDKEMSLRGFLTRLFRKPTPTPTSAPTPFTAQKPVLELNDEKKKELDRWYAEGNAEKYPESAADLKRLYPTYSHPGSVPSTQVSTTGYKHQIPYKTEVGGETKYIPEDVAQPLMEVFDPIGAATESAQFLAHPTETTLLPWEVPWIKNRMAGGENRGFQTKDIDIPNPNKSIDRGLFRINSDTFAGWMNNPKSREKLKDLGITSYEDMNDAKKNAQFARLLMESTPTRNPGDRSWRKWWAAPLLLRHPSLKK